ncbi:MAG TPA: PstS family phosphate ABC transporter substrate-binding protein [Bdellovibrionota bacterium]|jgi:phosphate transport system substrate-binding protein|nr:PstS family phosphate ABC transporter substrate-binding protein [Bdellovibrionota bacterium]
MKTSSLKALSLTLALAAGSAALAKDEGQIRIDGSSTVFPISEAVAEEFAKVAPKVRVNVGVSGTGGGFKKFLLKEIDISNASRHIKDSEKADAKKNGITYIEIPVAIDGITVVVNPKNKWASDITLAELQKIWAPDSKVKTWKDVRADWPAKEIKLYGPGTDSGTFDYFSEVIGGKSGALRSNYVKSEDDNVLVRAVAGEEAAMGFFGYAYYVENKTQLKALSVDKISPDATTIQGGTYKPLSRPVFIYVNKESLKKAFVKKFVEFYIKNAGTLSKEVGYVPFQAADYEKSLKLL